MPDAGGLQFLPETRKKIDVKRPGQNRPLVFGFIVLGVVLGLYLGLSSYKESLLSEVTALSQQLSDLERARDKQLEIKLLDLNKQLAVINPLLNSHVFWSTAFIKIQSLVQPQVRFKSMNADGLSEKILITATTDTYTTIARQIASFYAIDSVADIILNKVQSQSTGDLEFSLQITFDSDKFLTNK